MTPQDYKDILNNAGKWIIAMAIISAVCYLTIQGKISTDVIIAASAAVMGFYFSQTKNEAK
ncbi:MAG: hypothetical protein WCI51_20445 [Lentisphaerota bacterium]